MTDNQVKNQSVSPHPEHATSASSAVSGHRAAYVVAHDGGDAQRLHVGVLMVFSALAFLVAMAEVVMGKVSAWEVILGLVMYVLTGIGITMGFHRLLSHRSFKTRPVVRGALTILGSMAAQGRPIYWVSNHRRHHRFSDQPGDPHSPHWIGEHPPKNKLSGWWHAHLGWLLTDQVTNTIAFGRDLYQDPFIVRLNRYYLLWLVLGLVTPAMVGALIEQSIIGACKGLLWGGGVRFFFSYHVTGAVNSIGHIFGYRSFDTRERSTNNIWLALPSLGDAWHNNHHACPSSAFHGFHWWEIDINGLLIRMFAILGLVSEVTPPDPAILEKLKARKVN